MSEHDDLSGLDGLDDATWEELKARHSAIDRRVTELRQTQTTIVRRMDALSLSMRPERYPTPEQLTGIAEAVRRYRAGEPSKSHHGDPCGPEGSAYAVCVEVQAGRISVDHNSPLGMSAHGARLWDYTDEEQRAIVQAVEEAGLKVTTHWQHDRGMSLLVRLPKFSEVRSYPGLNGITMRLADAPGRCPECGLPEPMHEEGCSRNLSAHSCTCDFPAAGHALICPLYERRVSGGVCLVCGDGVLLNGEHIDPERHETALREEQSGE